MTKKNGIDKNCHNQHQKIEITWLYILQGKQFVGVSKVIHTPFFLTQVKKSLKVLPASKVCKQVTFHKVKIQVIKSQIYKATLEISLSLSVRQFRSHSMSILFFYNSMSIPFYCTTNLLRNSYTIDDLPQALSEVNHKKIT